MQFPAPSGEQANKQTQHCANESVRQCRQLYEDLYEDCLPYKLLMFCLKGYLIVIWRVYGLFQPLFQLAL